MIEYQHRFANNIQEGVTLNGVQVWRPSVAEPLWVGRGLKKAQCGCGRVFKDRQSFIEHYIYQAVWQNESGYIPSLLAKSAPKESV